MESHQRLEGAVKTPPSVLSRLGSPLGYLPWEMVAHADGASSCAMWDADPDAALLFMARDDRAKQGLFAWILFLLLMLLLLWLAQLS